MKLGFKTTNNTDKQNIDARAIGISVSFVISQPSKTALNNRINIVIQLMKGNGNQLRTKASIPHTK